MDAAVEQSARNLENTNQASDEMPSGHSNSEPGQNIS